jgi:hypothetical protein
LFFTLLPTTDSRHFWHWALLAVFVASTAFIVVLEIVEWAKARPRRLRREGQIKRYMERWIAQGGRTVIMSRDMSWADEDATKRLLRKKAEHGELVLCLQRDSEQLKYLRDAGATLSTYGHLDFTPRSRFTIIDFEKDGARVAIGVRDKGVQVIQEYQSGSHPLYSVAEDLVRLIQRLEPNP